MTLKATYRTVLVLATALSAAPALAHDAMEAPVMTRQGLVQGVPGKQDGVTVFKGLPFGAPPVGDLRWKPPQPPVSWDGVRMADSYGSPCIQPKAPQRTPINSATDTPGAPEMSEDCLYLNVWTPAETAGEKLPVMVWLYGGAYNEGGGNAPFSEGDNLAAKGAVVVTFNYRVGSLGFFAHPELTAESEQDASGNQALADSVAALEWVQENIAGFGGDPDRVTVFGESAGAAMIGGLLGATPANGLFHRAVPESGGWMGLATAQMISREAAEQRGVAAAQEAGAASLAELRALPAEEVSQKIRGQGMIVDGWIIPQDVSITMAEGALNPVDILTGSNADEGSFTRGFGPPVTAESWNAGAAQRWGDLAQLGLVAYPASSDEEARAHDTFADGMTWLHRQMASALAGQGQKAYLYRFTHVPPYDEGVPNLGASHTAEIPYVFNNLAAQRTFPDRSSNTLAAQSEVDLALADQISSYWVNFASSGDPNGDGLPHWPQVGELAPGEVMLLDGDGSGVGPWLTAEQIALYDAIYARDVAAPLGIDTDD